MEFLKRGRGAAGVLRPLPARAHLRFLILLDMVIPGIGALGKQDGDDAEASEGVSLMAACTLASWVDALGRRDRGESGFHRCRDPERHRDGPLQLSPSRQPSLDAGRGGAMEEFKIGDTVVRRGSVSARRGSVVRVTDGFFVTVKWPSWLGLDAYESTHPPDDLVRLMA